MIDFRKIADPAAVTGYISGQINSKLVAGQKVLWLVAGGSAMDIATAVATRINRPTVGQLSITLTDERYGKINHPDSNWQQLIAKGFKLPGATLLPVLAGKSMAHTAQDYARQLNQALTDSDYSLALAGMGLDGHIFGIKPGSPSVETKEEVAAYVWDDFQRITPTLGWLRKLDEVVIYAVGQEKHRQLDLLKRDLPPMEQPAQLLKHLKKVIIFNDYKGDEV